MTINQDSTSVRTCAIDLVGLPAWAVTYLQKHGRLAAHMRVPCGGRRRSDGQPCTALSVPGKRRCKWHGGCSTGPRTVDGKARVTANLRKRRGAQRQPDDFQDFLNEIGVTQEQMDAAALTMPKPIDIDGDRRHRVLPSTIEGLGVVSGGYFKAGDRVCTLMTSGKWTVCGRYMNHDLNPNIKAAADTGVLVGIAIREINEGDEFTLNYRQIKDALSAASPELVGSFHQQKARLLASLTEREASEPHIPHKPRTNEMEK